MPFYDGCDVWVHADEQGRKTESSATRWRRRTSSSPARIFCDCGWRPATIGTTSGSGRYKTTADYRKLRNTLRWMLVRRAFPLNVVDDEQSAGAGVADAASPWADRVAAYSAFDYKRVVASLTAFKNTDLSAFYVDVRKDVSIVIRSRR